jgi:acetyltransferase-like isoleucine patch superfamily enzyme
VRPDERAVGLVVGEGVTFGESVSIDPHVVIHDGVSIGDGVRIGSHVVIHEGSSLGEGCILGDHAILGKRPKLAANSSAKGAVGTLVVGARAVVGAGAIVFAGTRIESGAIVGDQSFVRERSVVGEGSVIGRGSVVDNDVVVGAGVRIQTGVYLTAFTVVEDDVFVGPGASTTNDNTMARHDESEALRGATLRRACRVGGSVVLTPGVEIGEEAFVAAGAVVIRDVAPRTVVMGVPARAVRQVPDEDLIEHWR